MTEAEEERRAALFRAQCESRQAAAATRCASLSGNAAAKSELLEHWAPWIEERNSAPLMESRTDACYD